MSTTPNLGLTKPSASDSLATWLPTYTENLDILDDISAGADTKPTAGTGVGADDTRIRFVWGMGDDDNDGLSWGSAFATVGAAYDSLPRTTGQTPFPTGAGTIYIGPGATWDATANRGFWVVGGQDQNAATPPTGWHYYRGPCEFIGVGMRTDGGVSNSQEGVVAVVGGSLTDTSLPALWLSGVSGFKFSNIKFDAAIPVKMGIGTNDYYFGINTSQVSFRGCYFAARSGHGPAVWMGYCFWIYFDRCGWGSAGGAVDSDGRACLVMDNREDNAPSSLVFIRDSVMNGGGIRHYLYASGPSLYCENLLMEGDGVAAQPPLVELIEPAGFGHISMKNCDLADVPGSTDPILVKATDAAATFSAGQVVIEGAPLSSRVDSPATLLGGTHRGGAPAAKKQRGFWKDGRLAASPDTSRRAVPPTAVRYANLASQLPASWADDGTSATVTTGKTGLDGLTNAAELSSASGTRGVYFYRAFTKSWTAGDWAIAGVWARSVSGTLNASSINLIEVTLGGVGTASMQAAHDGSLSREWQWYWAMIEAPASTTYDTYFKGTCQASAPVEYWAPVFVRATGLEDGEARELALHMGTWSDTASVGQVSMLRDQSLHIPSGYIEGFEISDPAAPAANGGRLYFKDDGAGKTQLAVRFNTGAVQVIATEP